MNIKKLTENELINLINTTTDLKILEAAENEFLERNTNEELFAAEDWVSFSEGELESLRLQDVDIERYL